MKETPKLESPSTEQVWRELHADLRRFLLRRVGREELADDLLQEVFLRIHRRIESLGDVDRLHAWVYHIAGNVVIDHYRAAAKRETPLSAQETLDVSASQEAGEPDKHRNVEVARWLSKMVEHLPDTHREAVQLAELEGVSQTEIARRLGLSVSGAKSRVQRGRQLLKESLDRCCRFELDRKGNVIEYHQNQPCDGCCSDDPSGADDCS